VVARFVAARVAAGFVVARLAARVAAGFVVARLAAAGFRAAGSAGLAAAGRLAAPVRERVEDEGRDDLGWGTCCS